VIAYIGGGVGYDFTPQFYAYLALVAFSIIGLMAWPVTKLRVIVKRWIIEASLRRRVAEQAQHVIDYDLKFSEVTPIANHGGSFRPGASSKAF
jgi:hypothetical protein